MFEKGIFAKKLLRLFVCLTSLFLLILLHVSPVYTDSNAEDNEMNMFRDHIEKVRDKYPGIDEKLMQVEEKLNTGIPLKECCSVCHVKSGNE